MNVPKLLRILAAIVAALVLTGDTLKRMAAVCTLICIGIASAAEATANEPKVVTLSCDGTLTTTTITNSKVDPPLTPSPQQMQKVGVVVNLDERTVSFLDVARINDVDAANVDFGSTQTGRYEGFNIGIRGTIDRVTGYMDATATTTGSKALPGYNAVESHYEMLCKATNRVF
jgi:hypothetical protein